MSRRAEHALPQPVLAVSRDCAHCAGLRRVLSELHDDGLVAPAEIHDLGREPDFARRWNIRSVPWLRIGDWTFTGAMTATELRRWLERSGHPGSDADYLAELLSQGQRAAALAWLRAVPERLDAVLDLLAGEEADFGVRLGAASLVEEFADTDALRALVPRLGLLARDERARVRGDACHYLGLSRDPRAREALHHCLADAVDDVREIAAEALELLKETP